MPLYEYICDSCKRKFTWLVGMTAEDEEPACPRCGSDKYHKIMSRVRRGRSEDEVMKKFSEEDFGDLDDPRQAKDFAKRMSKEFGDELGEDFEEEVETAFEEEGADQDISEEY